MVAPAVLRACDRFSRIALVFPAPELAKTSSHPFACILCSPKVQLCVHLLKAGNPGVEATIEQVATIVLISERLASLQIIF